MRVLPPDATGVTTPGFRFCLPHLQEEELAAVSRVISTGQLTNGPETAAFEQEMAANLAGSKYAIAVSSGTMALELALQALDVGRGTEVVTTPFTFAATVNAAIRCGATVRFADIATDYTIDPKAVRACVSSRTAVVLPVHLYGLPADMIELASLGVPLLEDGAQAHLAGIGDRLVGSLGSACCFSFYPTKNMTTGEGGAVTTDDAAIARRVKVLRNQGMEAQYQYVEVGTNARMSDLQAAIGRVQLRRLPGFTEARRKNAGRYLDDLSNLEWLTLPTVPAGRSHAWNQYTVQVKEGVARDDVRAHLSRRGVPTAVYYPCLLSDLPLYRDHPQVEEASDCPVAQAATKSVFSLPVHPDLRSIDLDRTVEALQEFQP